jgi:hypothetical protein
MSWLTRIALTDKGRDRFKMYGVEEIETISTGHYELTLGYMPMPGIYQLGIERKGLDFTDIQQQHQKFRMEDMPDLSELEAIISTVRQWRQKYGQLYVVSHNDDKTKKYFRILDRLGLNPRVENVQGKEVVVL